MEVPVAHLLGLGLGQRALQTCHLAPGPMAQQLRDVGALRIGDEAGVAPPGMSVEE
jgi:hypothetical protein